MSKKPAVEKQAPPALPTRFAKVTELVPYARNSRTHSPAQIELIANSMREFGFTNPVLADNKGILAGHGRVLGAQLLYVAGESIKLPSGELLPLGAVPVIDCSGWSDAQRRAYVIADNQIALAAGWDGELLKLELTDLKLEGFDLDLLGFGDALTDLLDPDLLTPGKDPDDVPAVPEVAHSKLGDQWVLGPHRLRCGDSTKREDWHALMQGELADCLMTDPPYNVDFGAKANDLEQSQARQGGQNLKGDRPNGIANDKLSDGDFRQFLASFFQNAFASLKPGAPAYVWHADVEGANFRHTFNEAGFKLVICLVWVKSNFVLSRQHYHPQHEPCLYGYKPGGKRAWFGGRKQSTVKDYAEPGGPFVLREDGLYTVSVGDATLVLAPDAVVERAQTSVLRHPIQTKAKYHPTQKPVALIERLLQNNARANDIVVDAFGGSGTTLMAAERLGMCARLMEFDPRFVDVICARYASHTGRLPVHAVTGEPFPREVIDKLTTKWEG